MGQAYFFTVQNVCILGMIKVFNYFKSPPVKLAYQGWILEWSHASPLANPATLQVNVIWPAELHTKI